MGWATLSGVAVMLVMIPFTRFISRKLAGIQRELMRVKDRRINTTSEALEGIKLIKLQAWELPFLRRIGEIRAEEMRVLRRWGRGGSSTLVMWRCRRCRHVCGTRLRMSLVLFPFCFLFFLGTI